MNKANFFFFQKTAFFGVVLLFSFLWMGMGGGGVEGELPLAQKSFQVKVTDLSGTSYQASRFTWEGKAYFQSKYGKALVHLPFEKLLRIEFLSPSLEEKDWLEAKVELRSGETLQVFLEGGTRCYGETNLGSFELLTQDMKEISFL